MNLSLTEFDFVAAGAKSPSPPQSPHETESNETFKYLCVETCLPPTPVGGGEGGLIHCHSVLFQQCPFSLLTPSFTRQSW